MWLPPHHVTAWRSRWLLVLAILRFVSGTSISSITPTIGAAGASILISLDSVATGSLASSRCSFGSVDNVSLDAMDTASNTVTCTVPSTVPSGWAAVQVALDGAVYTSSTITLLVVTSVEYDLVGPSSSLYPDIFGLVLSFTILAFIGIQIVLVLTAEPSLASIWFGPSAQNSVKQPLRAWRALIGMQYIYFYSRYSVVQVPAFTALANAIKWTVGDVTKSLVYSFMRDGVLEANNLSSLVDPLKTSVGDALLANLFVYQAFWILLLVFAMVAIFLALLCLLQCSRKHPWNWVVLYLRQFQYGVLLRTGLCVQMPVTVWAVYQFYEILENINSPTPLDSWRKASLAFAATTLVFISLGLPLIATIVIGRVSMNRLTGPDTGRRFGILYDQYKNKRRKPYFAPFALYVHFLSAVAIVAFKGTPVAQTVSRLILSGFLLVGMFLFRPFPSRLSYLWETVALTLDCLMSLSFTLLSLDVSGFTVPTVGIIATVCGEALLVMWVLSLLVDTLIAIRRKWRGTDSLPITSKVVAKKRILANPEKIKNIRAEGKDIAEILTKMTKRPNDLRTQQKGTADLLSCCTDLDDQVAIQQGGGFDVVIQAMQTFRKDETVNRYGMCLLDKLGDTRGTRKVVADQGLETVLTALEIFPSNDALQEAGLNLLTNILADDRGRNETIVSSRTVKIVVNAIRTHLDNAHLQERGCALFRVLIVSKAAEIFQEIIDFRGLDPIISAMHAHPNNSKIQEIGTRIFCDLAADHTYNSQIPYDRCVELAAVAIASFSNPRLHASAMKLFNLLSNRPELRRCVMAESVVKASAKSLMKHINDESIVEEACLYLSKMLSLRIVEINRAVSHAIDAPRTFRAAADNHPANLRIQSASQQALTMLTNPGKLGSLGSYMPPKDVAKPFKSSSSSSIVRALPVITKEMKMSGIDESAYEGKFKSNREKYGDEDEEDRRARRFLAPGPDDDEDDARSTISRSSNRNKRVNGPAARYFDANSNGLSNGRDRRELDRSLVRPARTVTNDSIVSQLSNRSAPRAGQVQRRIERIEGDPSTGANSETVARAVGRRPVVRAQPIGGSEIEFSQSKRHPSRMSDGSKVKSKSSKELEMRSIVPDPDQSRIGGHRRPSSSNSISNRSEPESRMRRDRNHSQGPPDDRLQKSNGRSKPAMTSTDSATNSRSGLARSNSNGRSRPMTTGTNGQNTQRKLPAFSPIGGSQWAGSSSYVNDDDGGLAPDIGV